MAIAIEKNPARAALIIENDRQLGVPNLEVINDHAPECLKSLPRPNAIFIGGGITTVSYTHMKLPTTPYV